jgi:NADH dehydrogenase
MIVADSHVLIVGAGFGGLEAARRLGAAGIHTTIVDRHNYHLFQPLLYQVATAALSPADIAAPIRAILSRYPSVEVVLGTASSMDKTAKAVTLSDGRRFGYDRLILATGASYGFFGHDEWGAHTRGLKTIEDARAIRSRLLLTFERAEMETDPERQRALMTIVIIGGGPTGVEMAGSIAELSRRALARNFRRIQPEHASIVLIEAGPRLLAGFPESLSAYTLVRLRKLGVDVRLNTAVKAVKAESVAFDGSTIHSGCIVWAAGVAPSPAGRWLGAETDRAGRVKVAPDLSVPGLDGVYVIGDLAEALDADGRPLPGLAQVAKQQGEHLGRALARNLKDGTPLPPFVFHDRGNAAIIGRHAAVFDFGRWRIRGVPAWTLWAIVHVYLLVGFGHRLSVSVQWLWRYLTFQRGARLIVEEAAPDA